MELHVQLVPISANDPLPQNVADIEFMITSGVELPPKRLQEIFDTATNLKVCEALGHLAERGQLWKSADRFRLMVSWQLSCACRHEMSATAVPLSSSISS